MIAFISGFGSGASLIVAIGAQNAYVLERGLKRSHVFVTAMLCTLCDFVLILAGIGGMGTLVARMPVLATIITLGGALFLFVYGVRALRSAFHPGALRASNRGDMLDHRTAILTALAVSLLNPHVYLDTVVLLGSIGASYPSELRPWFALGAMGASLCWFFGLAYGASRLTPLFQSPRAWQILDVAIGLVMWTIAAALLVRL